MYYFLNFLVSTMNVFLRALLGFKAYQWFSPHVGFELPNLTYMNLLALTFLVSGVFSSITKFLMLSKISIDDYSANEKFSFHLTHSLTIIIGIGLMWVYKIFLF